MSAQRCPVCNGRGIVSNGFYSTTNDTWSTTSTCPETCKSCGGSGVVWSPEPWPTWIEPRDTMKVEFKTADIPKMKPRSYAKKE